MAFAICQVSRACWSLVPFSHFTRRFEPHWKAKDDHPLTLAVMNEGERFEDTLCAMEKMSMSVGKKSDAPKGDDEREAGCDASTARLSVAELAAPDDDPTNSASQDPNPADPRSEIGKNVDLMSKISLTIDAWESGELYELCVAAGPSMRLASRIRHDYLLNNDRYLVKSLESLHRSLPSGDEMNLSVLTNYRTQFNKCRDNIRAWMEVNEDWRSRCTEANLAKYKGFSGQNMEPEIDGNLVFNHPALAVELGLFEVFRHVVEEMNINLIKKVWKGFVLGSRFESESFRGTLVHLAYLRGDAKTLQYLLSVPSFEWDEDTKLSGVLHEAIINDCVSIDCFQALVNHPKVNLNAPEAIVCSFVPPLLEAVRFTSYCGSEQRSSQCAQRVIALVEAGANPNARTLDDEDEDEDPYCNPFGCPPEDALAFARKQVRYSNWPHIWEEILDKMEHRARGYDERIALLLKENLSLRKELDAMRDLVAVETKARTAAEEKLATLKRTH